MQIGIPKEVKPWEGRVALIPPAAAELVSHGHEVLLESGAGAASGYADAVYRQAGVKIVPDAAALYAQARLIVKVKEPTAAEFPLLQEHHLLFSYLHLAANAALANALREKGLTAIAFETIEHRGKLPLLVPMSEIAGCLAVQIGCNLLHAPQHGRGVLLGGLGGAERGRVVILGAGSAGGSAARLAAGLGAEVVVFERDRERMAAAHRLSPNITALSAYPEAIAEAMKDADLLIGAVLIPGARAPRLVTADMVRRMRPGAVIIDIAVDQGGCIETIRATDYSKPTYVQDEVVHFGVTNMPGAVPRTASQAISAVLLPYVLRLAESGPADPLLRNGVNVSGGRIVHPAVAAALANGQQ